MSKSIRVNHPGDGAWVAERAEERFDPERDHSLCNYDGSNILGGFIFTDYLVASICVDMAGRDANWCSRELLWMIFDYAFVQLGVHKVIAKVASTNHASLAVTLRAGFVPEAVLKDVLPGGDMIILTMQRHQCRWLARKSRNYRSNRKAA
jgi:hypothetical protein